MNSMASKGGNQYLSSFWRVYNTLIEESPEVLETLADDWHWEKPDRTNGALTNIVMRRPIISHVDGKAQINFGSSFVAGHPKYPLSADAPELLEAQKVALDRLMSVAKQHSFQLSQECGDILFVNNLSIMHARDAFIDDLDHEKQRHVLRLWMLDRETSWPIAKSLAYKHKALPYDSNPKTHNLMTLSEWSETPRTVRVTMAGASCSHD
jgi:hypothetical protein